MFSTFDPATNAVITSATVNVYNPGTVTPISATIFDRLGNILSNPLTSDATTGLVDFYLNVAQEVDVVVSKGGFTTRTYSNVPVIDDSSLELTALLSTTGDLPYASGNNTPSRLPIGSTGATMYVQSGVPTWNSNFNISSSGNLGLGQAATSNAGIDTLGLALSGSTTQVSVLGRSTGNSSGTTEISGIYAAPATAATSFTCATVADFHATTPTKGSGSTITSAYGLLIDTINVGTNNYGIFSSAASGGSVNASLVALGDLCLGAGNGSQNATNATTGFLFINSCGGTPTGVPAMSGLGVFANHMAMTYDTSAHKIWVYDGGWKGVVVS